MPSGSEEMKAKEIPCRWRKHGDKNNNVGSISVTSRNKLARIGLASSAQSASVLSSVEWE